MTAIRLLLERTHAHAAGFLDRLNERPVAATVDAGTLRQRLGIALENAGVPAERVINKLVAATEGGALARHRTIYHLGDRRRLAVLARRRLAPRSWRRSRAHESRTCSICLAPPRSRSRPDARWCISPASPPRVMRSCAIGAGMWTATD